MTGDDPRDSEFWVPPLRGAYSEPNPDTARKVIRAEAPVAPVAEQDEVPVPARRRPPTLVIVGAAALLLLVPLGLVLANRSSGSDLNAGDDDRDQPRTTTTEAPTTTVAQGEPPWQTVEGTEGRFRISLPGTLVAMALDGDTDGLGLRMFPSSIGLATRMEQIAGRVLNGALTEMVAVDPAKLAASGFPADLVEVQGHAGFLGRDPESVIADYEHQLYSRNDLTVSSAGRLATPVGDMAWYDIVPGGTNVQAFARHYVFSAGDWAWVLVFWVSDFEGSRPTTDAIASSFEPLV